jgi:hypothetical protein
MISQTILIIITERCFEKASVDDYK